MAIQRLKSPYITNVPVANFPYLNTPPSGSTYSFISTGQIGTISGYSYRVHRWTPGLTGSVQFATGGLIDLFILAGGGSGGAAYWHGNTNQQRALGGGGGGAGGLLLVYGFEVDTNTIYTFSVGAATATQTTSTLSGNNSFFGPYICSGGGAGGEWTTSSGYSGGSGGGGTYNYQWGQRPGGRGLFGSQGMNGSSATNSSLGGGGGGYTSTPSQSSTGGSGVSVNFDGTSISVAAGGGGGQSGTGGLVDGIETGGRGGYTPGAAWQNFNGNVPTAYGCGGGGGGTNSPGNPTSNGQQGGGGSGGLIMIRYPLATTT